MSNDKPCHPSRCPSCRVPYVEHLGLIGTCAELLKVRQENVKLREALSGLIGYASSVDVDNAPWVRGLALRINRAMDAMGVSELQKAFSRYSCVKNGDMIVVVYNSDYWTALNRLENDQAILANAYFAEHSPKPLEAYLAFANVLCVEDAGLDYDAAVALAKAMHKRGMVIPNE